MALSLNGTSGISGIDGSAGTPALQGSDSNTGISFGADTVNINTGGTTRATVDSSGRVLVGTSSTSQSLTAAFQGVSGSSTAGAVLALSRGLPASSIDAQGYLLGRVTFTDNSQTPYAQIEGISDAAAGTNDYPGRLVFSVTRDSQSSPTERLRIKNTGAVDVNAYYTASSNVDIMTWGREGFGVAAAVRYKDASTSMEFYSPTGHTVAYTTTSDYRLKSNVEKLEDASARIKDINVYKFDFVHSPGVVVDGFLAHEVQAVVPEAVTGTKDEVDDEGKPVYQGIDQSKLVPLLTAALQEAIAKIESLETRLTALEGGAAQ